ncbi:MAG: hypothetical protein VB855_16810 [Pirellulaceae bacterium]
MISRLHKNHPITARSTQRATSNPGSPFPLQAARRFLPATMVLLLATLACYSLQAADPLFQPSGSPRVQLDRGSSLKLQIKPSPAPSRSSTVESEKPITRIQLPATPQTSADDMPRRQPADGILEVPTTGTPEGPLAPITDAPLELPEFILLPSSGQHPAEPAEKPTLLEDAVQAEQPSRLEPLKVESQQQDAVLEGFPIIPTVLLQEEEAASEVNPILNCRSVSCEETLRQLRPTLLSSILLDVTPSFNPNLSEPPPRLQEEVRQWKDQQGKAVASGQLADVKFSRVVIQLEDGSQQQFPLDKLSDIDRCYVSDTWGFPLDCQLAGDASSRRDFTPITLNWTASALCKLPGYFEDEELERYGFTAGPWIQPFRSGAHFLTDLAIVPYRAGIHPYNECIYTLGVFRPGSPAPTIRPGFPISIKGGLWQAGVITGGFYLFP